jgi:caa(3)-type oxidase subunit IV
MTEPTHTGDLSEQEAADTHSADHGSTTVLFGRTINQPVYTVVFAGLALITAVELALAELFERSGIITALLVILSVIKAVLVVLFYMHLKDDNPLYALALIIPLFIGLVSTIFLIAVPITGY